MTGPNLLLTRIPRANKIPISAKNGASRAISTIRRENISSTMEKIGFATPNEATDDNPLPATVADCMPIDVLPPAMMAKAHWIAGSVP